MTLVAPRDYYGDIDRKGELVFTITQGGQEATCSIPYTLTPPKTYFEVGDIYYNSDYEAVGVVCWVNPDNIREAKVIALEGNSGKKTGVFNGDFVLPDLNDGEVNTAAYLAENTASGLGSTADNSAIVWAAEYVYKGVDGWYLPAINEVAEIYRNRSKIGATLKEVSGEALPTAYCLSSTVTMNNGRKAYHEFRFSNGTVVMESNTYFDPFVIIKKVNIQ